MKLLGLKERPLQDVIEVMILLNEISIGCKTRRSCGVGKKSHLWAGLFIYFQKIPGLRYQADCPSV